MNTGLFAAISGVPLSENTERGKKGYNFYISEGVRLEHIEDVTGAIRTYEDALFHAANPTQRQHAYNAIQRLRKTSVMTSDTVHNFVYMDTKTTTQSSSLTSNISIDYKWTTPVISSTFMSPTNLSDRSDLQRICENLCRADTTYKRSMGHGAGCTVHLSGQDIKHTDLSSHVHNIVGALADQWGVQHVDMNVATVEVHVESGGETQEPQSGPIFGFETNTSVLAAVYSVATGDLSHETGILIR